MKDPCLADVFEGRARWCVALSDCRFALGGMPDASVDACVCDPPYGLSREPDALEVLSHWLAGDDYEHGGSGFMGKTWDSFVPGPSTWREVFRVLKPGGHLVAFGGTRTYDLLVMAIRIAGFEIRDQLCWLYGSGMPKSYNVSKGLDAAAGAEREVIGSRILKGSAALSPSEKGGHTYASNTSSAGRTKVDYLTAPATPEAQEWDGYGTGLKPGHEPIVLARKPLVGTIVENVLAHGTGVLNIDGCRIATDWNEPDRPESWKRSGHSAKPDAAKIAAPPGNGIELNAKGRWPANVVLSHTDDCILVGTKRVRTGTAVEPDGPRSRVVANAPGVSLGRVCGFADPDGLETVEEWECSPDCPVRMLDEQAGERHNGGPNTGKVVRPSFVYGKQTPGIPTRFAGEVGNASRFFYTAKAARSERDAGLDGNRNTHETVKSVDIMRHLVRLVTHPGSLVCDPFTGSGTTGVAVMLEGEGRSFVGIDHDPDHVNDARRRVHHVTGGVKPARETTEKPAPEPPQQTSLFDLLG